MRIIRRRSPSRHGLDVRRTAAEVSKAPCGFALDQRLQTFVNQSGSVGDTGELLRLFEELFFEGDGCSHLRLLSHTVRLGDNVLERKRPQMLRHRSGSVSERTAGGGCYRSSYLGFPGNSIPLTTVMRPRVASWSLQPPFGVASPLRQSTQDVRQRNPRLRLHHKENRQLQERLERPPLQNRDQPRKSSSLVQLGHRIKGIGRYGSSS